MGLYDSFYFADGVLPGKPCPSGIEFQTKSLGCNMDKFTVHKDNTITVEVGICGDPDRYKDKMINGYVEVHARKNSRVGLYWDASYKLSIYNSKLMIVGKLESK